MNGLFGRMCRRDRLRFRADSGRARVARAKLALEVLENRALLAYSTVAGSYAVNGSFVGTVTIQGDNSADALVIAKDLATNLLTHVGDDNTGAGAGQFADQFDWDSTTPGSQHLLADSGTTVSFQIGAGAVTHSVTLGAPGSPASGFAGTQFTNLAGPVGATRTITVDDSTGAVPAIGASAYSIDLGTGPDFVLSGPGFRLNETASANGGLTLKGGTAANTFNLLSTFGGEPVNLVGGPNSDTFNIRRLSSAVTVNGGGGADSVVVGNAGSLAGINRPLSISDTGGGMALELDDSANATGRTVAIGASSITGLAPGAIDYANLSSLNVKMGSGGDTVTVTGTPAVTALNTGAGDDTVNVPAMTNPLAIDGQSGADTVNVSNAGNAQNIQAALTVSNANGSTTLNIDDSADATARVVNVGPGTITGLTPATITFSDISHLILRGGVGGNVFTIADPSSGDVTVNAGEGDDTVNVLALTAAPLLVDGQGGTNNVTVGDAGSLQSILAGITVNGAPGSTRLVVDGSADAMGRNPTLAAVGDLASLSGIASAVIQYAVSGLDSLLVKSGDGDDALTVDFAEGNPVPVNSLGYVGGNGSNTLNLLGGVFTDEDYLGIGPGVGIILLDASAITFSDLLPINDVTTAANFTFTAPPGTGVLNLVDGPVFNGFQTAQFNGGAAPTFELMNFANKANVTINGAPAATSVTINNPTAAAGLATLTLNTDASTDQASLIATPPGVDLEVNLAGGDDSASAVGAGLASGTTPVVDGGSNFDVLIYDAGGVAVGIAAGGAPGEVLLSRPGSGTLDARNFEQITISNGSPVSPVAGPVQTVQGVEGTTIIDATLATFTSAAPGAKAADFLATIVWGDGTTTAGTITQDAGNPSVFYVTGTHTYGLQGAYVADIAIVSLGSSGTTIVNGVPVTILTPPGDSITATANIDVANAPLTVNVFSVTGTEGIAIPAGPIATFQDAGGAHPVGDYTATITILDANNNVVLSVPAASIVAGGAVGSFLVNAPAFTLARVGTYTVRVAVTDTTLPQPTTQTSTAQAVIANAALSATGVAVNATEGQAFTGLVATFTDANPGSTAGDFTATILWGDGHQSLGTVTQTGPGLFSVSGTNTYADAGSQVVIVTIRDAEGQTAVAAATATVAEAALAATGLAVSAAEAQPFTGSVATFTDANPLATAADFTASIDWGDGTPIAPGIISQAADGTFFVVGSHTYSAATPAGSPHTVQVTIQDRGGASVQATGTATVFSAGLNSTGAAVSAVEGAPFNGLVATFTDSGGAKPAASYTVVIDWGDGTTSGPSTVTAAGSGPLGTTFVVNGTHTYAGEGVYATKVTITSRGGSVTVATGSATVADAPLTAQVVPLSATQGVALVNATVATFTDAGGPESLDRYEATIDWGDGTPRVGGIVVSDGATFRVLGTHTYQGLGAFTIGVVTRDHGGAATTAYGTVNVNASTSPLPLTGALDPSSDTGVSQTDGITNDTTPMFVGTSQPGATVRLVAIRADQPNVTIPIGTTLADAAGAWRITSPPLADGTYTLVASAVGSNGVSTATLVLPRVVIDTVGPTVTSLQFDPLQGRLVAGFQDNLSGLDQHGLRDGANFVFTKARARPGQFLVTSLDVSPFASGNAPQTVTILVNGGRRLRGGRYALTVLSRGVQDRAGNALDGEFYGVFPSGNRIPGGDFAARFNRVHRRTSVPRPFTTTASPNVPPGTPGQAGVAHQRTAALDAHDLALATISHRNRRGGRD